MDDGREVGDGEEDEVGCGELDLVVLSLLDCHSQRQQVRGCLESEENLLQGWTACLASMLSPPGRRSRKRGGSRRWQGEAHTAASAPTSSTTSWSACLVLTYQQQLLLRRRLEGRRRCRWNFRALLLLRVATPGQSLDVGKGSSWHR